MSMCDWCRDKQDCHLPKWGIKAVENDDLYCQAIKPVSLPPISMGCVTAPFCAEAKSVTRRNWATVTVKRFKKDIYFMAWSKQARFGGEPIGIGRITRGPFKQNTTDMSTAEYIYEGFRYLDGRYYDMTYTMPLKEVFERWRHKGEILTVVSFEIIDIFPGTLEKFTTDAEIVRCVKALQKVIG